MNYLKPLSWFALAMLMLPFVSCDNEPIPQGLIPTDDPFVAEPGQFLAMIDGVQFVSDSTWAVRTPDGTLRIEAYVFATQEKMTMTIENSLTSSTFNLVSGPGSLNGVVYSDSTNVDNPFTTEFLLGAIGTVNITALTNATIVNPGTTDGNFTFTGVRAVRDDQGNIILDPDGQPIVETIDVTEGNFRAIRFMTGPLNDDDGNGNGDPSEQFFARTNGAEFVDTSVAVTNSLISDVPMLTILAEDAAGATIRIDIPEESGAGTYDLQSLSNGTQFIGLYQDGGLGASLTSNPGTLEITEFNSDTGRISGTFSFTATDPLNNDPTVVEITGGEFSLTYEPTVDNSQPPLMADVDGETYIPEDLQVATSTFIGVEVITIATTLENRSLNITFPASLEVGSYAMSTNLVTGNEIVGSYIPDSGNTEIFTSDPGTFEITAIDLENGIMEGTFSFSAVDQSGTDPTVFEITNGVFTIDIP